MAKQVGAYLALFVADLEQPAVQKPCEARLAHRQREITKIIAVHGKHNEGIELDLVIVLAGMQRVEVRAGSIL